MVRTGLSVATCEAVVITESRRTCPLVLATSWTARCTALIHHRRPHRAAIYLSWAPCFPVRKFKEHSACGIMVGLRGIEFLALPLISGAALTSLRFTRTVFL